MSAAAFPQEPFLWTNPLSGVWRSPLVRENGDALAAIAPTLYLCGMIGYALALPFRVVEVALKALWWVSGLFVLILSCGNLVSPRQMWVRTKVLTGSIGDVCSAAIGVACPLAAYRMDEFIQRDHDIHRYSLTWRTAAAVNGDYWQAHVIAEGDKFGAEGDQARQDFPKEFAAFKEASQLLVQPLRVASVDDLEIGTSGEQQKITALAIFILLIDEEITSKKRFSFVTHPGLKNIRDFIVKGTAKTGSLMVSGAAARADRQNAGASERSNNRALVDEMSNFSSATAEQFDTDTGCVKSLYPSLQDSFDRKSLFALVAQGIADFDPRQPGVESNMDSLVKNLRSMGQAFQDNDPKKWAGLTRVTAK